MNRVHRFPYGISLDAYPAKLAGIGLDEFFLNPRKAFEACLYASEYFGTDVGCSYFIPNIICQDFGGSLRYYNNNWPKIIATPIKTVEDFVFLGFPNPCDTVSFKKNCTFLKLCKKKGYSVGFYASSLLERMALLSDISFILKSTKYQPVFVHDFMKKMVEYTLAEIEAYINEFGAEDFSVSFAYSLESLIRPSAFYEFCAPYIVELHEEIYKMRISKVSESLCGNHNKTLKFWAEEIRCPKGTVITLDALIDFDKASEMLGEKYTLAGNISHKIFSNGTPQEVFGETRNKIDMYKNRKGGFIVSPDSGLPLNTPIENIVAFLKATEIRQASDVTAGS